MQGSVRQQGQKTSAFDGGVELTLVVCFGACQTGWHDFAVFLDKIFQGVDILVIDLFNIGYRETAEFFAFEQRVLLFAFVFVFVLVEFFTKCHFWLLYIKGLAYSIDEKPVI